ncbi:hypothetical protein GIB67_021088 [Kingdonia uniflora]|uniref:HD-Zip IV C-terminal domain-containing protein n=1 Tax=Kingdonia uniflora TaxID=39325 RepID=A0A7J7N6T5_9MAGN|nr:hypothetical protein GIB67_021088 [Kingdonia uniflora]
MTGGSYQVMGYLAKDRDPNNRISLLRWNGSSQWNRGIMIQETFTNPTESLIVYAHGSEAGVTEILSGQTADHAHCHPSGFVILPDGYADNAGILLTYMCLSLAEDSPSKPHPLDVVDGINNFIIDSTKKIKAALLHNNK